MDLDDMIRNTLRLTEDERKALRDRMYYDRKYPGIKNLMVTFLLWFIFTATIGAFSYDLYLSRASLMTKYSNLAKLVSIPMFGLLLVVNIDIAMDIRKFSDKYPEMNHSSWIS